MKALVLHIETPQTRKLGRNPQLQLEEAVSLVEAIDIHEVEARLINLKVIDSARLIGKGQVEILSSFIQEHDIGLAVFNHNLSPIQQRNLEKSLNIKVIDRTGLILEIFGARAATREGVLQVEAAHLTYQKSRLVRSWTHLERQRGGAGFMGGPGERQIESDRRALETQILAVEKRLEQVRKTRRLQRAGRKRSTIPVISLVGYTNAGKSTLFNKLTDENILAKDMLFATLDPTLRQMTLPSGKKAILADTVGFISALPHELVESFRATLEEIVDADCILHVHDISRDDYEEQAQDVIDILESIFDEEFSHKILNIWNKIDQVPDEARPMGQSDAVRVSAINGEGIDELLLAIDNYFKTDDEHIDLVIPFSQSALRAWLHEHSSTIDEEISEDGYHIRATLSQAQFGQFQAKNQS